MEKQHQNIPTAIFMISLALTMRQMSMSIVAPFISTYCKTLSGYTTLLAGLAFGIFGLTQAIFQTPFGMLSDKYGNKKIMLLGLSITVVGLLLAWHADTIYLLILARALQGSGAVIGVGYSWAAGITDADNRTKTMGILSLMVSMGAATAFILGPLLRKFMYVNQIFLVCAVTITINELYILFFIPDTKIRNQKERSDKNTIMLLFKNRRFMTLSSAAFLNNFMMMSVFFAIPMYLSTLLSETRLWIFFIPAIVCSVVAMKTAVQLTGKGYVKKILITAFSVSILGILCYMEKNSLVFLILGTSLFFGSYAALVTVIASCVNGIVSNEYRGTANGIYNAMQYMGNFIGPIVTGFIWSFSDRGALVPAICAGITGILLSVSLNKEFGRKKENTQEKGEI